MTTTTDPVAAQLIASGYRGYVLGYRVRDGRWRGIMSLAAVRALQHDPRFTLGPFHTLHSEVGKNRLDFRSDCGAFGEGSLQIVVDRNTGVFHADIDKFSPYQDARGVFGHLFGEVIPHFIGRLFKRKARESK